MNNYKRISPKTVFAFGPHYKACMTQTKIAWANSFQFVHKDGKTAEQTETFGTFWIVKVFGKYGGREQIICNDAKDAFHELRHQLHDYEDNFQVWGELLP